MFHANPFYRTEEIEFFHNTRGNYSKLADTLAAAARSVIRAVVLRLSEIRNYPKANLALFHRRSSETMERYSGLQGYPADR